MRRRIDRDKVLATLLAVRRRGFSLREAAALADVHVATVCRWQARRPSLRQALSAAAEEGRGAFRLPPERPVVRWRRDCPLCQARVVVRSTRGGVRFWRCGRWPRCPWASWRPRAARNCGACGGACYWSHSRKSTACGSCGLRTRRRLERSAMATEN